MVFFENICMQRRFNPFLTNDPILYPLKTLEVFGFLMFSGGIKWEHRPEKV